MPPVPVAPTSTAPGRAPPTPVDAARPAVTGGEVDTVAPSFELRLGDVVRSIVLGGDAVTVTPDAFTVDLHALGISAPGVDFETLRLRRDAAGLPDAGTLSGAISVPFVRGRAELTVDAHGEVSGQATATFDVEVLGRPQVTFSYLDRRFTGSVTVEAGDLRLPIPNVTVDEGRATVTFDGSTLAGSLTARFHHPGLGNGNVAVTIASAGIEGSGDFSLTMPLLAGSHGTITIDREGAVSAAATLTAADVQVPVPGLSITTLTGNIALRDGHVSGSVGLGAAYAGLGTLTVAEVTFADTGFTGANGTLEITAPPFQGSRGTLALDAAGRPSGQVTIAAEQIPIPALRRGQVTITLRPDGGVDVSGSGRVEIASVGGGDFTVGWENGVLSLGADVQLTVPGLQPVTGRVDWRDGDLSGEVQTGVTVGSLTGTVLLRYAQHEFSGEGRLDYALGRFSGWVLVRVDPQAVISGEGEAVVRFTDALTGTIGLTVLPDLNVDARGAIVFASSIELFPAYRYERSFFNFQQSFPLWGITIPVVGSIGIIAEIRASAGFRAAFGPGTFGNIRAEGEISTRPDAEPAFSISGDLTIPAGAEVVLSVGGGIGLAALIAQITGGINLEGIAGVYGSLTLTPTFAYRDGEYRLRGDALLAAVAQLRARINAYASVIAGIGWFSTEVWRQDWNLAEWRFDTGWQVGMRAGIEWVVGEPFVPNVELEPVEVDPQAIIRGAIPNSGEPVPAPPAPPAPAATFTPSDGTAAAAGSAAGGPPPSTPASVPAAPAPTTAPAAPGVAGAPSPEGAPAPPAAGQAPPRVEAPAVEAEAPEERDVEEQYLVYVYETLRNHLNRKARDDAPSEEELAKRAAADAVEQAAAGKPPSLVPPRGESAGKPLTPGVRGRMEQIFGQDFSNVRVHTDDTARESARTIGAQAYAVGDDVYFGPSRDPDAGDDELLAHELTHVVQGKSGTKADTVSRASDPVEKEAEEAVAAIKRGEAPKPVEGSGGAAIKRTEAQAVDAGATVPFTKQQWQRILADPALTQNPVLQSAIGQLQSEDQVRQRAKDDVYDATAKNWKPRAFVPMHFPKAEGLSHKNVFGGQQISLGMYLKRASGMREDLNQSLLSRLMYESGTTAPAGLGPDWFTRSPSGATKYVPTFDEAWPPYRDARPEPNNLNAEPLLVGGDAQATTGSRHNLNLTMAGFRALWDSGLRYFPGRSQWERLEPAVPPPTGAPDAALEAGAVQVMVADYEAHHVIPLWLESEGAQPSGDTLQNLVPWHKTAHQANHMRHNTMPPDVVATTGTSDYRDFKAGTRFLVFRLIDPQPAHPAGAPNVGLVADATKPRGYRWGASGAAQPIWMG